MTGMLDAGADTGGLVWPGLGGAVAPPAYAIPPLAPPLRAAYRRLIEERVGIRLSEQQLQGLDATLTAVLAEAGNPTTTAGLFDTVARGGRPDLFDALAARLAIGETHFFRVAPQIAALREIVLPDLLARRARAHRIAAWSAGCSTGEEPYTLAILLRQVLPAPEAWDLRLLATDLSEPALAGARRAVYRDWSLRETPEDIRRRFFAPTPSGWQLDDTIRRTVRFRRLNLVADPFPPPAALDLILCRNVTIYFSRAVAARLYRRFADALAPGGWLVVGPSDPPPHDNFLEPVYLPGAILWRKLATAAPSPHPTARLGSRQPLRATGTSDSPLIAKPST